MAEIEIRAAPSPKEVVDLILRLIGSTWPASKAERIAWFEEFDLPEPDQVERSEEHAHGMSFDGPPAPVWPQDRFGWHTFEDQFVGVNWFLWAGLPRDEVRTRARELKERLTQELGGPVAEDFHQDLIHIVLGGTRSDHGHVLPYEHLPPPRREDDRWSCGRADPRRPHATVRGQGRGSASGTRRRSTPPHVRDLCAGRSRATKGTGARRPRDRAPSAAISDERSRPQRGKSGRVASPGSGQLTSQGGVAQRVSQGHQPVSRGAAERLGLGREKGGDFSG